MLFAVTFDLDGVLADTRAAVRAAYDAVGIVMPYEAWGRPAHEWVDEKSHAAKQAIYPAMLVKLAERLPGAEVMQRLQREGRSVAVVTNASFLSATAVLEQFELAPDALMCGQKELTLATLAPACHVDDNNLDYKRAIVSVKEGVESMYERIRKML